MIMIILTEEVTLLIQEILLFFLFLDTFRIEGSLLFEKIIILLFPDTFRIQVILLFLLFLDTFRIQRILSFEKIIISPVSRHFQYSRDFFLFLDTFGKGSKVGRLDSWKARRL